MPTVEYMTADGHGWSAVWTEEEERIFVEKFLIYSKNNFSRIASFLPYKNTCDCVQFYYRNKRRLKLKQRLLQHRKNPIPDGQPQVKKRVGRPPKVPVQPVIEEDMEMEMPVVDGETMTDY